MKSLNEQAWEVLEKAVERCGRLGICVEERDCGTRILDAGVDAPGGLEAGLIMAHIGMSGLGHATAEMAPAGEIPWIWVVTRSDHPLEACYLSQAAHWQVQVGSYHAMGSGPACLLNLELEVGKAIGFRETADRAVLVLETSSLPDDETCRALAGQCRVEAEKLAIIVAPTSSLTGSVQIAARSVETGLHKLHQLGFNLRQVASGMGRCPAAAPTGDDLVSLGRTNDMVMYACQVWLLLKDATDVELAEWAAQMPASTSPSYGEPFLQTLKKAGGFYAIDPGLFAPAEVSLVNQVSGRTFHSGAVDRARLEAALKV